MLSCCPCTRLTLIDKGCYNIHMFLAINEMIKEKSRFVLIAFVIILVSYLVFFLTALAYGLAISYTNAIDKWDASGIILSKSSNDNIARSLLYETDYKNILSRDVAPLGVSSATVQIGETEDVALFGVDTGSFLAPSVVSGRGIQSDSEVVVSDELEKLGLSVGGEFKLEGDDTNYTIVGFVSDATFQTSPVVYMGLENWRVATSQVLGMSSMRDDTTISALVTLDQEADGYSNERMGWQTIQDFSFALPGYQAQVLTFSLMIGFLIGIAAFVLAIFIYILTMQKKSIFGVLKAEGISSSYIGRSVMVQVLVLSSIGLATGIALAMLTGFLLADKVPFAVNLFFFIGIAVIFLACAVIGGIASVRSVVKIDPVEAIG